MWVDSDGVVHARNCLNVGTISGDLKGDVAAYANLNLPAVGEGGPVNGTAQLKGTITLDGESAVSYILSTAVVFANGVGTGSFTLQGVGAYKGIHAVGTLVAPSGEMTGTIFIN